SRYVALFWVVLWFVSGIVAGILTGVDADQRRSRLYQAQHAARQARQPGGNVLAREEARRAQAEFYAAQLEASRDNWRPMVSYTANLSRVGQRLLDVDSAWLKLSELQPPGLNRDQFLLGTLGPQYPWYWSAGVLAALLGLSACILNFRVRSLDR